MSNRTVVLTLAGLLSAVALAGCGSKEELPEQPPGPKTPPVGQPGSKEMPTVPAPPEEKK